MVVGADQPMVMRSLRLPATLGYQLFRHHRDTHVGLATQEGLLCCPYTHYASLYKPSNNFHLLKDQQVFKLAMTYLQTNLPVWNPIIKGRRCVCVCVCISSTSAYIDAGTNMLIRSSGIETNIGPS